MYSFIILLLGAVACLAEVDKRIASYAPISGVYHPESGADFADISGANFAVSSAGPYNAYSAGGGFSSAPYSNSYAYPSSAPASSYGGGYASSAGRYYGSSVYPSQSASYGGGSYPSHHPQGQPGGHANGPYGHAGGAGSPSPPLAQQTNSPAIQLGSSVARVALFGLGAVLL